MIIICYCIDFIIISVVYVLCLCCVKISKDLGSS